MIEIKDLLSKLNNSLLKEELKKETIRNIISEILKKQIKSEDIKIKNGSIYLNIKPLYKSEILLKKDRILSKLKDSLGSQTPENIH